MKPGDLVRSTRKFTPYNEENESWLDVGRDELGILLEVFCAEGKRWLCRAMFRGIVLVFPPIGLEVVSETG